MHGSIDPFIPFTLDCARNHVAKQEKLGRLDLEETEDNVQSLVQYVIEQWPRYAADRCSRKGFIVQIISSRVISLVRKTHSLCRSPLRDGHLQDWNRDLEECSSDLPLIDHLGQRLDMATAIGYLTKSEAAFIKLVAEHNLVFAAKKLGMSRAKARGLQATVRTKMLQAGIEHPRWTSPRSDTAA